MRSLLPATRYAKCKEEKECREAVLAAVMARQPPNKEFKDKKPRNLELLGKPPEGDDIDLRAIRRPAFFAAAPWKEAIAEADTRTWIVEFTAPRDPYERNIKKMTDVVKLRGWYLRGDGVDDGKGGRQRALVVMSGGGGTRVAAITDPAEPLYYVDAKNHHRTKPFPTETSGASGQNHWRETVIGFNRAGFDVLVFDRRGVGISTGFSDTNTLQQGRDLLAIVAALRTGEGVRALSPEGQTLKATAAAEALRGPTEPQGLPVLLMGNSRGTMASGWAMTMNFHRSCTYDLAEILCAPPIGDKSIKGAILFAEFTSGPGYNPDRQGVEDAERTGRDRTLWIAGNAVELNVVFYPSSAILAGMSTWPAMFFARGLWDYAGALQGTVDSYGRVKGLKELVVVRGPHPFETWPASEQRRARERAIEFAKAVILGKTRVEGAKPWANMKELVATTPDAWEASTKPTLVP
jgi:pimeloyl-ACP methyl ester carboxylesterase